MTGKVIFIRHSQSHPDPTRTPRDWILTEQGRARCLDLARWLIPHRLAHIYTSTESKAIETGQIIADHLAIPTTTAPDLHETDYGDVPFYPDHADFVAHVLRGFDQPDAIVFGAEAFSTAADRFSRAVDTLIDSHPGESIAIVTHGRVLAAYLSRRTNQSATELWQSFTMPAALIYHLPDFALDARWFCPDRD